jgi:tetratricopeptide (TPR) repeat protein
MRVIPAALAALMLLAPWAGFAQTAVDCKPAIEARLAQEQKDRNALVAIMTDFRARGLNGVVADFDALQDMVDRAPAAEIAVCDGVRYVRADTPPEATGDKTQDAVQGDRPRVVLLPSSPYPLAAATLGAGYTALSQWADAERVLARGLVLDPQNATLISGDAVVLSRLGRAQAGLELCDRFLAVGGQPAPERARVLRMRGYLLGELGRYDDGVAAYQQALALQPGDIQAQSGIDALTRLKTGGGRIGDPTVHAPDPPAIKPPP